MNTACLSPRQWHRGLTVLADKLAQSSWMKSTELPVVGIMAPLLVVTVAWLGSAQGLSLVSSQGLATILGLALVSPYMLKLMLSSIQTGTDVILSTAQMNPAEDVSNSSGVPDLQGWFGPMANSISDLSESQLELLIELLVHYQETGTLTQHQWAEAQATLDTLDEYLPESSDA